MDCNSKICVDFSEGRILSPVSGRGNSFSTKATLWEGSLRFRKSCIFSLLFRKVLQILTTRVAGTLFLCVQGWPWWSQNCNLRSVTSWRELCPWGYLQVLFSMPPQGSQRILLCSRGCARQTEKPFYWLEEIIWNEVVLSVLSCETLGLLVPWRKIHMKYSGLVEWWKRDLWVLL